MYRPCNFVNIPLNNVNYAMTGVAYSCAPPVENSTQCRMLQEKYPQYVAIPIPKDHVVCPGSYPVIMDLFGR